MVSFLSLEGNDLLAGPEVTNGAKNIFKTSILLIILNCL